VDNITTACALCASEFPQPTTRGGKVKIFCSPKCRVAGANARRATTRAGRNSVGATNPRSGEPSGRPSSSTLTDIPPSVDMAASEAPSDRLSTLMAKAHSREGIDAWEIAELAKLRGISPWVPLRVIIAEGIVS
jgi:hypothetical protein